MLGDSLKVATLLPFHDEAAKTFFKLEDIDTEAWLISGWIILLVVANQVRSNSWNKKLKSQKEIYPVNLKSLCVFWLNTGIFAIMHGLILNIFFETIGACWLFNPAQQTSAQEEIIFSKTLQAK